MGTHYVVIDKAGKNGLDVGKFRALAAVAGVVERADRHALSVAQIREAAKGWPMDWGTMQEPRYTMEDVKASEWLSSMTERWAHEIAQDRALTVCAEAGAPWGDWQGKDPRAAKWTLWTLYIHPVVGDDAMPPWRLFPPKAGS